MRIAFITSGLEPGRDGVGDYTRRLAGELIQQGHSSIILGLNDSKIDEAIFGSQEMEGTSIPVLRLPSVMPWNDRAMMARKWIDAFDPDWVSLQFVPFGFHPKGLPFALPRHLMAILGSRPLHWMFHELWVLWSFPLSLRKRLLGQCQKFCLRWCLRKLRPQAVATQLPLYQAELSKIGLAVDVIPLHGGIPIYPNEEADQWLADRCMPMASLKRVKAGFFGNILSTLNPSLFAAWVAELNVPKNELLLLSAGKIGGESATLWNSLEQKLKMSATFLKLGELNEREASLYFSALDYGLTSYPPELMRKSSSVAVMYEHGLPVISCGSLDRGSVGHTMKGLKIYTTDQPWTVNQSAHFLLQQLQVGKS